MSFVEDVISRILDNESVFVEKLMTPVPRDPLTMLSLLQNSDLGSYQHFENYSITTPVLELEHYLDMERCHEESHSGMSEQMMELDHIHRKMIFDSVNETLSQYRPWGE